MSDRRRVNLSLDPLTCARLDRIRREYGFGSLCELLTAAARLLADRLDPEGRRLYDLPEDDARYIDGLFEELGEAERSGGVVPGGRGSRNSRGGR